MKNQIEKKLIEAGFDLPDESISKFCTYFDLLFHWNRRINLTAINNEDEAIIYHLLDSLSVLGYLKGDNILDVGTGAGLPGVILAIMRPQLQFTLLDSKNKKIQFLNQVKHTLKLNNVSITQSRIETFSHEPLYSCIVCRAFSSTLKFYELTTKCIQQDGVIIAMKGKYPEQEIAELNDMQVNYEVESVTMKGLNVERHLVLMYTSNTRKS